MSATEVGPFSLIVAALSAPLLAVDRRRETAHAVTMESLVKDWATNHEKRRVTFKAACGERVRLYGTYGGPGLWPPRVKGAPFARCRTCFDATPEKRPRCEFVARSG